MTLAHSIALAKPRVHEMIADQVRDRIMAGDWSVGDLVGEFENRIADRLGRAAAAGVNSGGTALELAARVSQVPAGGTVLVPAFVCPSVPTALRRADVRPRFVDCDATLHLDPEAVAAHGADADGVILTHCFGQPGQVGALVETARDHDLTIIEDLSQAIGAESHGEPVGQIGDVVAGSCGATKPLAAAEGGFVAGEPEPAASVRHLRDSGQGITDARAVSGRLSDLHAAIVMGQLDSYDTRLEHRRFIASKYRQAIREKLILPVADGVTGAYHAFPLTVDDRAPLIRNLRDAGIETTRFYTPMGQKHDCPTAHATAKCILCVPIHNAVTQADVKRIAAILDI